MTEVNGFQYEPILSEEDSIVNVFYKQLHFSGFSSC